MIWGVNLTTLSIAAAILVWLVAVLAHRAYHAHYVLKANSWRKPGFWQKFSLRHAISAEIFHSEDDITMDLYARLILFAYRALVILFYLLLFADLIYLLKFLPS